MAYRSALMGKQTDETYQCIRLGVCSGSSLTITISALQLMKALCTALNGSYNQWLVTCNHTTTTTTLSAQTPSPPPPSL